MKTAQKPEAIKRLTYDGKRNNLIVASVVIFMIRVPNNEGGMIECSTAEEAIEVLKFLSSESEKKSAERHKRERIEISRKPGPLSAAGIAEQLGDKVEVSAWSKDSFWKFVESLGELQVKVLSYLLRNKKASDEEIRKLLKVDGNQALAGVLSGISKQAANHGVSARAVYTVEDERKGGDLFKTYAISNDFAFVASQMNWPGD
jgi:hypothetical protein